jgi:hypothetical protein
MFDCGRWGWCMAWAAVDGWALLVSCIARMIFVICIVSRYTLSSIPQLTWHRITCYSVCIVLVLSDIENEHTHTHTHKARMNLTPRTHTQSISTTFLSSGEGMKQ